MDDEQLSHRLQALFAHRNAENFNVLDFVYADGSPLMALMYVRLFWPEFVEFEDMIFLKESVEDDADRARVREALGHQQDRAAIESSFNLKEMHELFGPRINETTDDEDQVLMTKLREMWDARLNAVYNERRFIVTVVQPEENGGNLGITFYQHR
jgi:hypothetical protein